MQFQASLKSVRVDNEGESTVTLSVPQSELTQILELTQATQMLLNVSIEVD
jgi:hypothetical protein